MTEEKIYIKEAPKCCNKPMELKCCWEGLDCLEEGVRYSFQCKECGGWGTIVD